MLVYWRVFSNGPIWKEYQHIVALHLLGACGHVAASRAGAGWLRRGFKVGDLTNYDDYAIFVGSDQQKLRCGDHDEVQTGRIKMSVQSTNIRI